MVRRGDCPVGGPLPIRLVSCPVGRRCTRVKGHRDPSLREGQHNIEQSTSTTKTPVDNKVRIEAQLA